MQTYIMHQDDTGKDTDLVICSREPAIQPAVELCLTAPIEQGTDGRSRWYWFRLSNGDLILGFYPQGETYLATEAMRSI